VPDDLGDQAVYQRVSQQLAEFRLAGKVPEHLRARPVPHQRVHCHDGERQPGGRSSGEKSMTAGGSEEHV